VGFAELSQQGHQKGLNYHTFSAQFGGHILTELLLRTGLRYRLAEIIIWMWVNLRKLSKTNNL